MPKSNLSIADRFWSYVQKTESCWLWHLAQRHGYGQFALAPGKPVRAHRYAFEVTYGPIPEGMHVLHRCDTPLCVRPDHLFLGTAQDNMTDKVAKGRQAKGDRHGMRVHPETRARGEHQGNSKLTNEQAREIRRRRLSGESRKAIAMEFGVSPKLVYQIALGEIWTHV